MLGLLALNLFVTPESFFIGTYTAPGGSQGIYRATVDAETGALSTPVLAAEMPNPSYLARSPDGLYLYAVNESGHGSVNAYSIGLDGELGSIATRPLEGSAPCHVSVDSVGQNVFTASYVGGVVECLPRLISGSLGPPTGLIVNSGHGPNPERQEASHMHWIRPDPSDKFIYSCDLGTDLVQCYRISPKTRALERVPASDGHVPPGSGPRHGAWGPDGRFFYVNGEMGNNVTVFSTDRRTGALTARQTLSTLPEGAHSVGSAEIAVHPNGRFLYVSNRGHNSIAVFAIEKNGTLSRVQVAPAGVRTPRGFAIDPSGRWLIAAGQDSNDLTTLAINAKTGLLGPPTPRVPLGSPVCIVFVGG